MDCDLFPDYEENQLCNHFDRHHIIPPAVVKTPHNAENNKCEHCSCSSKFINLNGNFYGRDQSLKRSTLNTVSVMETSS